MLSSRNIGILQKYGQKLLYKIKFTHKSYNFPQKQLGTFLRIVFSTETKTNEKHSNRLRICQIGKSRF